MMFNESQEGQTQFDPEAERLARSSEQSDVDSVRASFKDWFRMFESDYDRAPDRFESYQAGLAARDEWQPISTVPLDGFHIQLYRPEIQFVGYYAGANGGWRINSPGLPSVWPLPTHWMPLPNPPKETT